MSPPVTFVTTGIKEPGRRGPGSLARGQAGSCSLDGGGGGVIDLLAMLGAWGPCLD